MFRRIIKIFELLGLGRHELTAAARGALLGETPLPKTQIKDTQEETIKQNLTKILGKTIDFVSNAKEKEKDNNKELDFISIKDIGKDMNVFRPFISDPQKQARYEKYLENKTLERDSNMDRLSEWERNREMVEFEQAAKLYRPLSGVIGDRYVFVLVLQIGEFPKIRIEPTTKRIRLCATFILASVSHEVGFNLSL